MLLDLFLVTTKTTNQQHLTNTLYHNNNNDYVIKEEFNIFHVKVLYFKNIFILN